MLVETMLPGQGTTYLDATFLPRVQRFITEARLRGVVLHFNGAFRPAGVQARLHADPRATGVIGSLSA